MKSKEEILKPFIYKNVEAFGAAVTPEGAEQAMEEYAAERCEKLVEALEDCDSLLMQLEDSAHGKEGDNITWMRKKISDTISHYKKLFLQGSK